MGVQLNICQNCPTTCLVCFHTPPSPTHRNSGKHNKVCPFDFVSNEDESYLFSLFRLVLWPHFVYCFYCSCSAHLWLQTHKLISPKMIWIWISKMTPSRMLPPRMRLRPPPCHSPSTLVSPWPLCLEAGVGSPSASSHNLWEYSSSGYLLLQLAVIGEEVFQTNFHI